MSRLQGTFSALFLMLIIIAGCAPSARRAALRPNELRLSPILTRLDKNQAELRTIAGRGKITVESPAQSFSGDAVVYLKMPDSLFVKLEGLFGVDAGMFFSDQRRFAVFLPTDRVAYIGEAKDTLRLKPLIGFDLTHREVLNLLIGRVRLDGLEEAAVSREGNALKVIGRLDGRRGEFSIDPRIGAVTRAVVRDEQGNIQQIQEYRRFLQTAGVTLPQMVRVIRPQVKESFTLFYHSVQVNRPLPAKNFYIKLPPEVIQIRL